MNQFNTKVFGSTIFIQDKDKQQTTTKTI